MSCTSRIMADVNDMLDVHTQGTGGGPRVNLPRPNLPPPTLISPTPTPPDNRTFSQWLTEKVELWFGEHILVCIYAHTLVNGFTCNDEILI